MSEMTPEQVEKLNAEMGEEIIAEIADLLAAFGCCHGHEIATTPPMFYPEMARCALLAAYNRGKSGAPFWPVPADAPEPVESMKGGAR